MMGSVKRSMMYLRLVDNEWMFCSLMLKQSCLSDVLQLLLRVRAEKKTHWELDNTPRHIVVHNCWQLCTRDCFTHFVHLNVNSWWNISFNVHEAFGVFKQDKVHYNQDHSVGFYKFWHGAESVHPKSACWRDAGVYVTIWLHSDSKSIWLALELIMWTFFIATRYQA